MSTSAIISEVSLLLRSILEAGLKPADPNPTVKVESPVDLPGETTLSIWLYQVSPNAHLRNAPNSRVRDEEFEAITPLALDLFYLLSPLQKNEVANQRTLGRALQVLYDNSVLPLHAGDDVEELHLNICPRSIAELAEVWEALQKPYRLSVCVEVRVVRIDSLRTIQAGRVRERATNFEDKPVEVEA
ncbi:MAG: DUF4255 domain-containing protein [Acidobacteriota bacterium]